MAVPPTLDSILANFETGDIPTQSQFAEAWTASYNEAGNVVSFGADPSGVADSSSALVDAINSGVPVYFPPGTYNLATWTPLTTTETDIVFYGSGKLVGNAGAFMTMPATGSIDVSGVSFESFSNLFTLPSGGTYTEIKFKDVDFNEVRRPINDVADLTTTVERFIHHGGKITNTLADAVRCTAGTIGYASVKDVEIVGVSTLGSASASPKGVNIGEGSAATTATVEFVEVSGCFVKDIIGTAANTIGILANGVECNVNNNHVTNVDSTAETDIEGIYTKSLRGIVSNNILNDAGYEEAAINIKGTAPGTTPEGNEVICHDNQIYFSQRTHAACNGIKVRRSYVKVHDNKITGANRGIVVDDDGGLTLDGVTIESNDVKGSRPIGVLGAAGIYCVSPLTNLRVIENDIFDIGDAGSTAIAQGVGLKVENADTATTWEVIGNKINDLKSSTTTNQRGIFLDAPGTETLTNLTVNSNRISNCDTAIRLNNVSSVVSNLKILDNDTSVGITTEFNMTSVATGGHFLRHYSEAGPGVQCGRGSVWYRAGAGANAFYVKESDDAANDWTGK